MCVPVEGEFFIGHTGVVTDCIDDIDRFLRLVFNECGTPGPVGLTCEDLTSSNVPRPLVLEPAGSDVICNNIVAVLNQEVIGGHNRGTIIGRTTCIAVCILSPPSAVCFFCVEFHYLLKCVNCCLVAGGYKLNRFSCRVATYKVTSTVKVKRSAMRLYRK